MSSVTWEYSGMKWSLHEYGNIVVSNMKIVGIYLEPRKLLNLNHQL